MLAVLRAFGKSWVAAVFMSALMMSFLFIGVRDVFHPKFSNAVVTAGSHETSPGEFKRDFEIILQQWSQQNNQQLSIPDAITAGFDQHALTEIESRAALSEYLTRIGVHPSDHLVDVEINEAPAFFNALGEFDQATFDRWLQATGLSAQEVKDSTRDDLALKHLATGLAAGLRTPEIYGALFASFSLEGRNISYFIVDPHSVPAPTLPTDAQLQTLINQNTAALTRPEMRTLSVVRFSAKDLAPNMPVDQAKVQALYEAAKGDLSQPEKRTLVEFATRDAGKAAAIAAKLKAGQAPDAIAKALGVQPITYDSKAKGDVVDPAVADAAFSAQSGQVVGPIPSSLAGFAVIQVTKVTPPVTPTLDQLRPQLEAQVKTNAAIAQVFDAVKKYEDSHNSGANLADAARASGATPVEVGPITQDGHDLHNQPVAGLTPQLLKEAFALPQGAESELEDEGNGEYFALRVEKITPPTVPALAEIKTQLTQLYMQQTVMARLSTESDALVQAMKKGETLEAAAAQAKAKPNVLPNITRQALEQGRQLDPGLIEKLFDAKQGDVVDGQIQSNQMQIMVARIDAVHPAAGADVAHATQEASKAFNQQIFQDMIEAAQSRAVATIRPQGDITAAREALGISPDDTAKSGARPKRGPAL